MKQRLRTVELVLLFVFAPLCYSSLSLFQPVILDLLDNRPVIFYKIVIYHLKMPGYVELLLTFLQGIIHLFIMFYVVFIDMTERRARILLIVCGVVSLLQLAAFFCRLTALSLNYIVFIAFSSVFYLHSRLQKSDCHSRIDGSIKASERILLIASLPYCHHMARVVWLILFKLPELDIIHKLNHFALFSLIFTGIIHLGIVLCGSLSAATERRFYVLAIICLLMSVFLLIAPLIQLKGPPFFYCILFGVMACLFSLYCNLLKHRSKSLPS